MIVVLDAAIVTPVRVGLELTVIVTPLLVIPLQELVMTVVPPATPATMPEELTVAFDVSLDAHELTAGYGHVLPVVVS